LEEHVPSAGPADLVGSLHHIRGGGCLSQAKGGCVGPEGRV